MRLGLGAASWAVLAADGVTPVPAQLVPASPADSLLRTTYYGAPAADMHWLALVPPPLPAVGYTLVFLLPVAKVSDAPATSASVVTPVSQGASAVLRLGNVSLGFDDAGLLANYSFRGGLSTQLHHNFRYYVSSLGNATASQVCQCEAGWRLVCHTLIHISYFSRAGPTSSVRTRLKMLTTSHRLVHASLS